MSLTQYNKKRRFNETPEPKGKERSSKGSLRFVVQKHDASHVHYDFRLEMEGVLKSWAVPKGPSLNPSDKRLAMMVEDHPFDYRDFEGVIPAGNYGGGTVIVWDEGTYSPIDKDGLGRKEQEKLLLEQLASGNLKIALHGQKLQGQYALFQMKGRGDRSWILVKKEDAYASEADVTEQNTSVKTGRTIAQVAAENGTVPNHPEEESKVPKKKNRPVQLLNDTPAKKKAAPAKASPLKSPRSSAVKTPKAAGKKKAPQLKPVLAAQKNELHKVPMPQDITPMLATLVNEPFDSDDWIFEIKWDGYRALAYCGGTVELVSRNRIPFTDKYFPVTEALQQLGIKAVLDGEIVALNEKGMPEFQLLQNWQNTPAGLQYFIFDILWLEGYDLTALPLTERKKILRQLLPQDDGIIKYSDHVTGKGNDFFKAAVAQGLEGIMAKKASGVYKIGERSNDWLKIKVSLRQEVIIAGYTEPRKTRKYFGSLLLGIYDDGELVYVGHTGSGFTAKSLEAIHNKLQPLITGKSPFDKTPKTNTPATWVQPKLVCEIKFTEWTKDRMARHPIFMGMREDKKPKEVIFEKAKNMATLKKASKAKAATEKAVAKKTATKKAASKKPAARTKKTSPRKKDPGPIDISKGESQQIILNGHEIQLTSLSKLYWKKEKFSKADTISYYLQIAPYILPYMRDRPQSLNRHPNGIDGQNFFQKDMKGKLPEWMPTHEDFSESTGKTVEYLVCSNEATLIYMANMGCIEMHPWHSRSQSWQYPDWCLIDLDPDDGNTFEQVIETAQAVKKVLDAIGAASCVKTSGSSGIHIYIPLAAQYDYDQSKQLAELIVTLVHHEMPDITSLERSPAKRKGKIYLDYLQNRQTQTAAAPYSLRPKPGMPVSTPLHWSEVKKGLTPTTWNAKNIFDRLKTEGDLFKPVLGKGIDLEKILVKLAVQMK